jgi:hypothetical protein
MFVHGFPRADRLADDPPTPDTAATAHTADTDTADGDDDA